MTRPKNLLLIGRPGIGKTTALLKVAELMRDYRRGGFVTREVRVGARRVGFQIETFGGAVGTLAHVARDSGPRVGKYRVDVAEFERVGVTALEQAVVAADVIFLDEIGKMELFSERFRAAVLRALNCSKPVLATVMIHPHPFVDGLKRRQDVKLIEVTLANRDRLPNELCTELVRLAAGSSSGCGNGPS
ncbi:MAG: NTPase [Verrucomicrobiae bacterium]|nr:NTPase [Verrucomicrobiae bacterium]